MRRSLSILTACSLILTASAQWGPIASPFSGSLYSFGTADANVAYIGGAYKLLKSTDAGATWNIALDLTVPPPIASLGNDIAFPDALHGYVVSNAGKMIKTTDGGATWTNQNPPTEYGLAINTICFTAGTYGFVGGELGDAAKTTTSGTVWSQVNYGTYEAINDIAFFPGTYTNVGLAVGEAGTIRRTVTYGNGWLGSSSGTTAELYGACCVDQDVAIVVGTGGTILRSVDRGLTWTSITSGTSARLQAVRFADGLHGYAVGDNGLILGTTNGGLTWAPEASGATADLYDVGIVGGHFVVVGLTGVILRKSAAIGIDEEEGAPAIAVFPLPARDRLHVRGLGLRSKDLTLIDPLGRIVEYDGPSSEDDRAMDVSDLVSGTYFLIVGGDLERSTSVVIVQH